jgi:antitoxin VapB
MTLIINHPEADRLAQELATRMGEPIDEAIVKLMKERLESTRTLTPEQKKLRDRLIEIGKHCASLPVLDPRSPDEILGYDENGLPS